MIKKCKFAPKFRKRIDFNLKHPERLREKIKLKSANITHKVKNSYDFKHNLNYLSSEQSYALPLT